jgi:hypothetical protein
MLIGVGGAVAKTPAGWGLSVTKIVGTIGPGSVQGYRVTISNTGPSNIAKLYLTTTDVSGGGATAISPVYPDPADSGCDTGVDQGCPLGAFPNPRTLSFTIAYQAADGDAPFDVKFEINTNGFVLGTNKSHGDSLPRTVSTPVNSSADFAGGFSLEGLDTFTTGDLTSTNHQSSSVTGPDLLAITVTEDGTAPDVDGAAACVTYTCIGQWAHVSVGNGHDGPVKVVLNINGVPSSVHASDIVLYHSGDGVITNHPCDTSNPPTNIPCYTVTKVSSGVFKIVAWLANNGGMRGGY